MTYVYTGKEQLAEQIKQKKAHYKVCGCHYKRKAVSGEKKKKKSPDSNINVGSKNSPLRIFHLQTT